MDEDPSIKVKNYNINEDPPLESVLKKSFGTPVVHVPNFGDF